MVYKKDELVLAIKSWHKTFKDNGLYFEKYNIYYIYEDGIPYRYTLTNDEIGTGDLLKILNGISKKEKQRGKNKNINC